VGLFEQQGDLDSWLLGTFGNSLGGIMG